MISLGTIDVSDFYEKTKNEIPDFFYCFLCKVVMLNAFQLSCGHLVCEDCKVRLEKENEMTCLSEECKKQVVSDPKVRIYEDKYITRKIQTHTVVCKNVLFGCNWEGEMAKYKKHLQNCLQSDVGFAGKCQSFSEPHHIKEFIKLLAVDEPCTKCQYCDKDGIKTEDLDMHQRYDCPKAKIVCPYVQVGCPEHQRKSLTELEEHKRIGSQIHLELFLDDYCSLRRQCGDEFSKLYRSEKDWRNLERDFKRIEMNFLTVTQKGEIRINDIENRLLLLENRKGEDNGNRNDRMIKMLESKLNDIEAVLGCLQEDRTVTTGNGNIEKRLTQVELMLENFASTTQRLEKISAQKEKELAFKTARVESLEAQMKDFELTTHDGTLIWQITNFTQQRHNAITKKRPYILSPFFYSGPRGYKMCIRLYLNGDGHGKGTHISLFFTVMKGSFDALLPWPFKQPVRMSILDQNNKNHCEDSFRPDPTSPSFQRPKTEANISSGCPLFMPLSALNSNAYIKDDCMFIKVSVDNYTV